jgi:hypothetical protein
MALVLLLGWEEMFVREERGFWWGFRCLVHEDKEKHWERKVNEGKVFLCFFKCCIIFQVLLLSTTTLWNWNIHGSFHMALFSLNYLCFLLLLSYHFLIPISSRYKSPLCGATLQIVVIQCLHFISFPKVFSFNSSGCGVVSRFEGELWAARPQRGPIQSVYT